MCERIHAQASIADDAPRTGPGSESAQARRAAKRAIAARAAELCASGESIIVGGGTTTALLAEHLPVSGLQVLTNSVPVLETLLRRTKNRVLIPGGEVYPEQRVVVSPADEPTIASYRAATVFMGVQGIGPWGLVQSDLLLVQMERALIERAARLVVLADASKFEGHGSVVLCKLERVSVLITDEHADASHVASIAAAGVEVIRVPVAESTAVSAA